MEEKILVWQTLTAFRRWWTRFGINFLTGLLLFLELASLLKPISACWSQKTKDLDKDDSESDDSESDVSESDDSGESDEEQPNNKKVKGFYFILN